MKGCSSTAALHWKLSGWSAEEGDGTPCVAVKCVDIWKNTGGEGGRLVWILTLKHESVGSK